MCYGQPFNPFYIGPFPDRACGDCPYGIFSGFTRCGWTGGNGPFGTTFCDASGDCPRRACGDCPRRACGRSGGGPWSDPYGGSGCGRPCDPYGCSWFSPCRSPGCRPCCRPSRKSCCVPDCCVMCSSGLGCCGEPSQNCYYPYY